MEKYPNWHKWRNTQIWCESAETKGWKSLKRPIPAPNGQSRWRTTHLQVQSTRDAGGRGKWNCAILFEKSKEINTIRTWWKTGCDRTCRACFFWWFTHIICFSSGETLFQILNAIHARALFTNTMSCGSLLSWTSLNLSFSTRETSIVKIYCRIFSSVLK